MIDNLVSARKWWQNAVFYQIFPRSFADGNGDGVGDFVGMIDKLDYLAELGIQGIWLSPFYPSPLVDYGYDPADHTDVAPEYGTLADFDHFLAGAHQRGIRVIIDFVLNHTSDQHCWFRESRSSRGDPKRDWYIWRDGKAGGPPNNWASWFGGSAWEFDELTGQYYYHCFFKQQPDLNWRNPEVREAMWGVARFWLDRGVDGFRLDALGTLLEDPDLSDHVSEHSVGALRVAWLKARTPEERLIIEAQQVQLFRHQLDLPEVHELMKEIRSVADEYEDRVLVGETDHLDYHGRADDELHLVFNFPLMHTKRLTPAWVRSNQLMRELALPEGAWPCNTLGNHDEPRVYSRYANGEHADAGARFAAALLLTLRGTPFLYNGEEIGMTDLGLDDISRFKDMMGIWLYEVAIGELGVDPSEALRLAARYGRDKERTPMQWSGSANAGFCPVGVQPWLPINSDYSKGVNVAAQQDDPRSLLNFYRRLIRVRREAPALIAGDYRPLHDSAEGYLAFLRTVRGNGQAGQACLVILNASDRDHHLHFDLPFRSSRCLFSSHDVSRRQDRINSIQIAAFELYVGELY